MSKNEDHSGIVQMEQFWRIYIHKTVNNNYKVKIISKKFWARWYWQVKFFKVKLQ